MLKKTGLQIIFWIVIITILLVVAPMHRFIGLHILFAFSAIASYIFLFYFNIFFLFPRFYAKKRISYILISAVLLLTTAFVLSFFFMEDDRHGHHGPDMLFNLFGMLKQLLWMVLIFLISTIYAIQDQLTRQSLRHKQLMEEKLQTELQLLKAQINPHFLFNALNNIYSLTYLHSEKAPESVLKLSEMLRYVIEDCCSENVPLKNEVAYINSYIDFHKMKSPNDMNIIFKVAIDNQETRIAPMLFIPFIENAFKYSRIEEDAQGYVHIALNEAQGRLSFVVKNSLFSSRTLLPGSGKGIANVRQRLEIIYPNRHWLTTNKTEQEFSVSLNIDSL